MAKVSISSPVFEVMFYGELAENKDSIELPDCEYKSLLELFHFIYNDEVNLSSSNVMGVLYLAKKYMVPSLVDKCEQFLGENLDATNVFNILPFAEKYEARNLMAICWKLLDKESEDAFKSDAFSTIERSLLEVVVKRDTLNIKEINLFFAIDKWARKACERQGLIARGKVKRRILGENVVKEIRSPVMTFYEFAKFVIDCQILTQKEVSDIVKYFASCLDTQVGFPEFHRAGPIVIKFQRCCRFNSVVFVAPGGGYSPGRRDCLLFEVTRDIILHGLILCGRKNERYSVTVQISDLYSAIHEETGCFLSTCFQPSCQTRPYYGFEVLFSNSIVIPK